MIIEFDGMSVIALVALGIGAVGYGICWLLDWYCNRHYGSKLQRWLYKHLLKRG